MCWSFRPYCTSTFYMVVLDVLGSQASVVHSRPSQLCFLTMSLCWPGHELNCLDNDWKGSFYVWHLYDWCPKDDPQSLWWYHCLPHSAAPSLHGGPATANKTMSVGCPGSTIDPRTRSKFSACLEAIFPVLLATVVSQWIIKSILLTCSIWNALSISHDIKTTNISSDNHWPPRCSAACCWETLGPDTRHGNCTPRWHPNPNLWARTCAF